MLIIAVEQQNKWPERVSEKTSVDPNPSQPQNLIKCMEHFEPFDFKHNPEGAHKYRVKQKSGTSTMC